MPIEEELMSRRTPRHEHMVDRIRLNPLDILLYSWFGGLPNSRFVRILLDGNGLFHFERPAGGRWFNFGQLSATDDEVLTLMSMVADFGPVLRNTSRMDGGGWSDLWFWQAGVVCQSELPLGGPTPWQVAAPAHLRAGAVILERLKEEALRAPATRRYVRSL
jgi:hypothetical protein